MASLLQKLIDLTNLKTFLDQLRQLFATKADIAAADYQSGAQVDRKIDQAKTDLQNTLGGAFTARGSTPFAELPALADAANGDVWNISDAFTTTDDFVEGAGRNYPSGTNVVRVSPANKPKWDTLSGVTDLSDYVRKQDMQPATDAQIDQLFA